MLDNERSRALCRLRKVAEVDNSQPTFMEGWIIDAMHWMT